MRMHTIILRGSDVLTVISGVAAIGALANAWWHPGDAAPTLLISAVFGGEVISCLTFVRPRTIAAAWWIPYEIGPARTALVQLIEQSPSQRAVFDPVDEVVLICRHDRLRREMSVTRIGGEDYAALVAGIQSFLVVETFSLRARGAELVAHHLEPWALILDDRSNPIAAEPIRPVEAPHADQQKRLADRTGLLFATTDDVRILSAQLCRAMR
ncbi:hypothetical protein [Amycolatopsis sp. NPDC098790]|uniref:hypothetical protein n=1 Tax=Amycolatopsis sp. NPDC098790 TaxID=3363939 RepID=UPI0038263FD5